MRSLLASLCLVALFGCASGENEIQVCPRTVDRDREIPWAFEEEALQKLAHYVNSVRKTPVPLILDHGETAGGRAAGFIDHCRVAPNGLFCTFHWTPWGRAEACTGAWRYISPHVNGRQSSEEHFIIAYEFVEISLTNAPKFDGMRPVPIPICIALPTFNFTPPEKK